MKTTLRASWRDLFWIALPLLIWVFLIQTRGIWIKPYCNETPSHCTEKSVPWPDQISVHIENSFANQLSFVTQNTSGAVAATAVLLFHAARVMGEAAVPTVLLAEAGVDLLLLGEVAIWNGASLEVGRALVQRPRPFVYKDPEGLGENPSHYTSFYSGHTSFSASVLSLALLILMFRKAGARWVTSLSVIGSTLVFSTALLRVLAGRHFITDVLAGLIFGVLTAWIVFRVHLSKRQAAPNKMSPEQP